MRGWCAERRACVVPTFAFRRAPVVIYHLPSELLLFIPDAPFAGLILLPLLPLGGLVALMALFTDIAMLLFASENSVSILFSKALLIHPKPLFPEPQLEDLFVWKGLHDQGLTYFLLPA